MENISLVKILGVLKKNFRTITLFAVLGLIVGILYALIIFKPVYKSTAKLLVKDTVQPTIVTDLAATNRITGLARDSNPTLTQIQILTSGVLADKVWREISSKYKFRDNPQVGAKMMQGAITVQNPVGTDIIEVTAKWHDPRIAKDIADGFVIAYIASNIDVAKRSVVQSKESINNQLAGAEANLANIRNQIRMFRQANSTVDLQTEASNIVTQLGDLENRYHDVASSAAAEANRVNSIASRLGIDWSQAINSVALGHNRNIGDLQSRLGTTQEQLAGLTTKYAPTHPAVIALKSQINEIKTELAEQIKQTVGSAADANGMIISDPVRTDMMQQLVNSEATYRGLLAQTGILKSAYDNLQARKSAIPIKQQVLSNLLQEEANWTQIVNTLKAKQIEANIRESEIISNISLIDAPTIPLFPTFPARSHIALMFTVLGALFGVASVMTMYFLSDSIDDVDQIEEELQAPVFGVIPWLDKQTYNQPDALVASDNTTSYYNLSYQKVVSTLRIKGYNSKVKALVFSSTEFSKARSTMLMNIAYGLNKSGQSVVVVDTDFRTPSIHKEFNLPNDDQFNLGKLLISINKELLESGDFNWKYLSYFTQEVPGTKNLHVLTNNDNVSNPYEYLHLPSFNLLIQKLKEQYDWVLLDAPPALAVPDAVTLGACSDGVILIAGLDSTKSMLRKLYKLFSINHVPIFGVIARELQDNEAVTANEYIRQMISRMMPDSDTLIEK